MKCNFETCIEKCNDINNMLIKEKNYLKIVKGYCENERRHSEELASLYDLICDICSLHEELTDSIDDAIIGLSS